MGEQEVPAQTRLKASQVRSAGLAAKSSGTTGKSTTGNETSESADQATQPDTGPALHQAILEMCRLFLDMDVEQDALGSAVKAADFVDIELSAGDLVCAFHAAQRAFKVVEERVADARAHEQRGRVTLRDYRRTIDELFQRAMEQAAGTTTHDLLGKLRVELGPVDREATDQDDDAPLTSTSLSHEIAGAT